MHWTDVVFWWTGLVLWWLVGLTNLWNGAGTVAVRTWVYLRGVPPTKEE